MPIRLPNLDDRRYEDLLAEALGRIPINAPEWTNHNTSDPGITLVELFAFLTEMLIYRLNRVTDANVCKFLKLIDGVARTPAAEQRGMVTKEGSEKLIPLNDEVRDVVLSLRRQDRAVTAEDFERLALAADPLVKRAYCVPQRQLTQKTAEGRRAKADGHVSVVVASSSLSVLQFGSEEQTRDAWLFRVEDLIEPTNWFNQLVKQQDPLSRFLFGALRLERPGGNAPLPGYLVERLNTLIQPAPLYEPSLFAHVRLRAETLMERNNTRSNRMLLEDAYPNHLVRRNYFKDFTTADAQTSAGISLLPRSATIEPRLYVGSDAAFAALKFNLAGAGANYTLDFKYFDGKRNDWVQLTDKDHQLTDSTANWTSSGLVTFTAPPDWKATEVNGVNQYWIAVSSFPKYPTKIAVANQITTGVIERVVQYLEVRRLLTTRLHVVGPRQVKVAVHLTLYLQPDAVQKEVAVRAAEALQEFFDPLRGGPEQTGWPFGRAVYVSEVYALLDRVRGVDYVTRAIDTESREPLKDKNQQPYPELTVLPADAARLILSGGVLEGIRLEPDELAAFVAGESHLQMIDPKVEISQSVVATLKPRS